MPASDVILAGLAAIAIEWRALAIAWHVVFGVAIAAVSAGWRPSQRATACGLTLPVISVSVLAWQSGNPFNALVFASLAMVLFGIAVTLPAEAIRVSSRRALIPAAVLIVFAWTYPHFIEVNRWTTYLYASPLGLIPCPTLALLIGISLALGLWRSVGWRVTVAATGVAYGLIGVFRLSVALDYGLLLGAVALLLIRHDRRLPNAHQGRVAVAVHALFPALRVRLALGRPRVLPRRHRTL